MEFFLFLIFFLCLFLPTWNLCCQTTEYIRDCNSFVERQQKEKMDTVEMLWGRVRGLVQKVVDRVQQYVPVQHCVSQCRQFSAAHPVLAASLLVATALSAVPLITFLSVVLVTLLLTFLGFLFVNGTVVAIALAVLGGIVCTIGLVVVGVGAACTALWCLLDEGSRLLGRKTRPDAAIATSKPTKPKSLAPRTLNGSVNGATVNGRHRNGHVNGHVNGHANGHVTTDVTESLSQWEKVET